MQKEVVNRNWAYLEHCLRVCKMVAKEYAANISKISEKRA
ncbi:MAG: hypothetical protein UU98_C0009G0034 [Parcubacteria group bacterium GW2011_GWD2_42_14]|nr:MAG: hypothetical protein UU98_C0009G0034 [Parcubacteria group bacterium GW2011_GWD2_42_14]